MKTLTNYTCEELKDATVFENLVKTELDDIKYPKVNRVYKVNTDTKELFDIVEEVVEDPTIDIQPQLENDQYTRETWQEIISNRSSHSDLFAHIKVENAFFDEDIISAAKGFMIAPVGVQRNKGVVVDTFAFSTLEEMKIFIINVLCKTQDMFLYMTYMREITDFSGVSSPNTCSFEFIEKLPKKTQYCLRGVFLDKQIENSDTK
jgi:hypothetical protein